MDLRPHLEGFDLTATLGEGNFGTVFKAQRKDLSETARSEDALKEARLLSQVTHPYVVQHLDSFVQGRTLCIVMEHCERGDLSKFLEEQAGKLLPEQTIWRFFIQMCLALEHLHTRRILHRDFKSMNIFLSKTGTVKVGDFGVATVLTHTAAFAHSVVGTPYYLSPELCKGQPYNAKSDVWALGCVLYELCTLTHPFNASNQGALVLKILRAEYVPISSRYSTELQQMLKHLLQRNYKRRPSVSSLLQHPHIRQIALGLNILVPAGSVLLRPAGVPRAICRHQSNPSLLSRAAPSSQTSRPANPEPRQRLHKPRVVVHLGKRPVAKKKRNVTVFLRAPRARTEFQVLQKPQVQVYTCEEQWHTETWQSEDSSVRLSIPFAPSSFVCSPLVVHSSRVCGRQSLLDSSDEAYDETEVRHNAAGTKALLAASRQLADITNASPEPFSCKYI